MVTGTDAARPPESVAMAARVKVVLEQLHAVGRSTTVVITPVAVSTCSGYVCGIKLPIEHYVEQDKTL